MSLQEAPSALGDAQRVTAESMHDELRKGLQDVAFGSVAGIFGKYIEYPFDTVKVRLQSQPSSGAPLYTGPLDCFKQSIRRDGVLALYRGVSAPLVGAAIENSSLFFSYRMAQKFLSSNLYKGYDKLPLEALGLAGAISGAFTSFLLTPIELVKCKMQVPSHSARQSPNLPGPLQIISTVLRQDGLLGFWRGQLGTLIRETGGGVAWFGSFEGVTAAFKSMRPEEQAGTAPPIYQQLFAGACAGMSYNFLFYPADTIKSCMQTEDLAASSAAKRSFLTVGRSLWRDQGLKGMYRGCGITVARSAPSSAIVFTIYENLKHAFG